MFTNGFNKGLIFVSHNSHHTSHRCGHISTDCGHQHPQMSIICRYIDIYIYIYIYIYKKVKKWCETIIIVFNKCDHFGT